jgi:hypothetical protein
MNHIDPIEQVLMDFFAECVALNPEGDTRLVDYQKWARKIRNVTKFECPECDSPLVPVVDPILGEHQHIFSSVPSVNQK